jgi:hypothetical protein
MLTRTRLLMIAPLLSALLSALLLVLLSGGAAHAALPDPTRPPAGLTTANLNALPLPRTASAVPMDSAVPPRMVRPVPAAAPAVPRVQALQRPTDAPSSSATALIDGRLVRIGDRLGDATVQEIRPDGVWLRLSRGSTQWLGLYALVETPPPDTTTTPIDNPMRKEP